MSAATYDPPLEQGADFAFGITCYSDADNTEPVNLTGCTFKGQARRRTSDATLVTELTVAIYGDPTDGTILVSLTAAQTAALALDESTQAIRKITSLSYDVYVTFPNGAQPVVRVLEGVIQASPSDTRSA